jgi:Protein-L-isoaspartate(D-aspartate) O-methyltransferase (PCMT)
VIVVTAGGPQVPKPLLEQLAVGGRLVIPVGDTPRLQRLVRVTRIDQDQFDHEDLGEVQFVPLIGAEGWDAGVTPRSRPSPPQTSAKLIRENAEPIDDIDQVNLDPLLDRIADARVVLVAFAISRHRHRINRLQRENRSDAAPVHHSSVLRCRWAVQSPLHTRSLRTSAENASNLRLGGGGS